MKYTLCLFLWVLPIMVSGQEYWHGIERKQRYFPEGEDIVIQNGNRRFNRALYGGHTAFRAEAGDLPEFALYLPGMGGNLKFGLLRGARSKWLTQASSIKAIYRSGSMLYSIKDSLFNNGELSIHLLASYDREELIIKITGHDLPDDLVLLPVFGGVQGKKFSRDGDIGADPESSFDLKPEYCKGNIINIQADRVSIRATTGGKTVQIRTSPQILFRKGNADAQMSPMSILASAEDTLQPIILANTTLNEPLYISLDTDPALLQTAVHLASRFNEQEETRKIVSKRIIIQTPDPYINAMAGPLSIASDAIWDSPSYMHGAIAWRMRLNGWRGGYIADVLGWHDRARLFLDAYLNVQIKSPVSRFVEMDTALLLARNKEELGNSLFSAGYISREPNSKIRPHHYDMNLVFFDQLFNHLNYTGDTAYARSVWDAIVLHLDWEKRNFDADNDGLYDAYAAIWASDALQYSGGAVTHSTAYNYRANLKMIELGRLLGKDVRVFQTEAKKIINAVNKQLWITDKGWYAEYKDQLGNKLVHDQPGLWTIYHAIDEGLADPFQSWQSLRFIDDHIPHIPMHIKDFPDHDLYTLSTTNWQPYTWSLNNVALSELMHTALAYWQGQRKDEAFRLFKSSILESMFFGASPGNVQQLTFYDAMRGELYRDFADAIGTTGRSLTEGLFGINPNLLHNEVLIRPGFPKEWDSASFKAPDFNYRFQRIGNEISFWIDPNYASNIYVKLQYQLSSSHVKKVIINGVSANWKFLDNAIGQPVIEIVTPIDSAFSIKIITANSYFNQIVDTISTTSNATFQWSANDSILTLMDPQNVLTSKKITNKMISGKIYKSGSFTLFVKLKNGTLVWWHPIHILVKENRKNTVDSTNFYVSDNLKKVDISAHYNSKITDIFKYKYLSPRPIGPTLQLPIHGIGNWAYPLVRPEISDVGLRKKTDTNGIIMLSNGLSFKSTSDSASNNIIFVSKWDNFPDSILMPLSGTASFIHLLMAGSTNPMQSRITNGLVEIEYIDGSSTVFELKNPENWWPIEQDYFVDDYAFTTNAPRPLRVSLKTGEFITKEFKYMSLKGYSAFGIDGGAATILRFNLDNKKILKSVKFKAIANDVIMGILGITLEK